MNPYVMFFIGAFVGSIIACLYEHFKKTYGTLKVDTSNPETDKYRIYIDDLDVIHKKNKLVLKIDHNADLSQD